MRHPHGCPKALSAEPQRSLPNSTPFSRQRRPSRHMVLKKSGRMVGKLLPWNYFRFARHLASTATLNCIRRKIAPCPSALDWIDQPHTVTHSVSYKPVVSQAPLLLQQHPPCPRTYAIPLHSVSQNARVRANE